MFDFCESPHQRGRVGAFHAPLLQTWEVHTGKRPTSVNAGRQADDAQLLLAFKPEIPHISCINDDKIKLVQAHAHDSGESFFFFPSVSLVVSKSSNNWWSWWNHMPPHSPAASAAAWWAADWWRYPWMNKISRQTCTRKHLHLDEIKALTHNLITGLSSPPHSFSCHQRGSSQTHSVRPRLWLWEQYVLELFDWCLKSDSRNTEEPAAAADYKIPV